MMAVELMEKKSTHKNTVKKMVRLYNRGDSPYTIATKVGLSATTVRYYLFEKEGLTPRTLKEVHDMKRAFKPQDLADDYNAGESAYDIADKYGIPSSTVYFHLRSLKVPLRTISEAMQRKKNTSSAEGSI